MSIIEHINDKRLAERVYREWGRVDPYTLANCQPKRSDVDECLWAAIEEARLHSCGCCAHSRPNGGCEMYATDYEDEHPCCCEAWDAAPVTTGHEKELLAEF